MRQCIERAIKKTDGLALDDFLADIDTQSIVLLMLMQAGEAAARLIEKGDAVEGINLIAMRGMRNQIVHNYLGVDPCVIWDTVKGDLPGALLRLNELLT